MVLPPHPALGPGTEPAGGGLLPGPVDCSRDPKVQHGVLHLVYFFSLLFFQKQLYSPFAGFDFLLTISSVQRCFCVC